MSTNASPDLAPPRWLVLICFCVAILPATIAAWNQRDVPHLGLFHDDAVYWSNAKALAHGDGYRIMSLPTAPAQTKYPPLYPALLSIIWRANPDYPTNLPLAMLLSWLFVPPFFFLCRRTLTAAGASPRLALATTTLVMLTPMFTLLATSLMSEIPFCLLLFASLSLLEGEVTPRRALFAGAVAGLAYLLRTGAMPLLFTAPLLLFIRRQRVPAMAFFAGMLPFMAGWTLWVATHKASASDPVTLYYTDYVRYQLTQIPVGLYPTLIWKNLAGYCGGVGQLIIFLYEDLYPFVLFTRFLGVVAIIGTVRMAMNRGDRQYALYALGLTGILTVWHYPPNWRFVFPLFPLLMLGFVSELLHFVDLLRTTWRRNKKSDRTSAIIIGAPAALFVIAAFYVNVNSLIRFLPDFYRQQRQSLALRLPAYDWIRSNTPSNATFSAYDDVLLYLHTGRQAAGPPVPPAVIYEETPASYDALVTAFPQFLDQQRLGYVLMTPLDFRRDLSEQRKKFETQMAANPRFHVIGKQPGFTVYQRNSQP